MLTHSFQHIPGIGAKTERQLWESGISGWESFFKATSISLSNKRIETIKDYIEAPKHHLAGNNPNFFRSAGAGPSLVYLPRIQIHHRLSGYRDHRSGSLGV